MPAQFSSVPVRPCKNLFYRQGSWSSALPAHDAEVTGYNVLVDSPWVLAGAYSVVEHSTARCKGTSRPCGGAMVAILRDGVHVGESCGGENFAIGFQLHITCAVKHNKSMVET